MATDLINCDQKGTEMSLYYDTSDIAGASTCATPVWVFNKAVTGDMEMNDTEDKEEQSSRDPSRLYKEYAESKPDLEITGEMMVDRGYDGFNYVNAARSGSFSRNFLILSSYITNVGAIGFKGKFRNFDRSISGPEQGSLRQKFTLAPGSCVLDACRVQPVEVAVANAVVVYDPGVVTLDVGAMIAELSASDLYRGIKATNAETVYTDIGPIIKYLGLEVADDLATSLVEFNQLVGDNPRSAIRKKPTPMGLAGFNRTALAKAFDELVLNAKPAPEPEQPKASILNTLPESKDYLPDSPS